MILLIIELTDNVRLNWVFSDDDSVVLFTNTLKWHDLNNLFILEFYEFTVVASDICYIIHLMSIEKILNVLKNINKSYVISEILISSTSGYTKPLIMESILIKRVLQLRIWIRTLCILTRMLTKCNKLLTILRPHCVK